MLPPPVAAAGAAAGGTAAAAEAAAAGTAAAGKVAAGSAALPGPRCKAGCQRPAVAVQQYVITQRAITTICAAAALRWGWMGQHGAGQTRQHRFWQNAGTTHVATVASAARLSWPARMHVVGPRDRIEAGCAAAIDWQLAVGCNAILSALVRLDGLRVAEPVHTAVDHVPVQHRGLRRRCGGRKHGSIISNVRRQLATSY